MYAIVTDEYDRIPEEYKHRKDINIWSVDIFIDKVSECRYLSPYTAIYFDASSLNEVLYNEFENFNANIKYYLFDCYKKIDCLPDDKVLICKTN